MRELEKRVYKHLKERGWHQLRPSDIAKSIAIESGKLLELFQWENKPLADIKRNKEKVGKIGKELADVLMYALDMAVLLELDTEKIIRDHLKHIKKKYPATLMKKYSKDEPGTEDVYWRIKRHYRRLGK